VFADGCDGRGLAEPPAGRPYAVTVRLGNRGPPRYSRLDPSRLASGSAYHEAHRADFPGGHMTSMEWAALAIGAAILATLVTLAVGLTRH